MYCFLGFISVIIKWIALCFYVSTLSKELCKPLSLLHLSCHRSHTPLFPYCHLSLVAVVVAPWRKHTCDMTWSVSYKVTYLSLPQDLGWQFSNIFHSSFLPFILLLPPPAISFTFPIPPADQSIRKQSFKNNHYKWNQCSGKPINLYILPLPQAQDLNVIEEVIRMMLEIINSCLCNSLHHNPNLVYALLYKRELFEQFRTHPSFQDIMQNLDTVSWLCSRSSPKYQKWIERSLNLEVLLSSFVVAILILVKVTQVSPPNVLPHLQGKFENARTVSEVHR